MAAPKICPHELLDNAALMAFESRFMPEPNTGCWLWTGRWGWDGYRHVIFAVPTYRIQHPPLVKSDYLKSSAAVVRAMVTRFPWSSSQG